MAKTAKRTDSPSVGSRLSEKASAGVTRVADTIAPKGQPIPGPSPNAATNLIIHDLALRSVGRFMRNTVERGLLGRRYSKAFAKDVVNNRSLAHSLLAFGATKIATRSLPGAAVVWGGLLAKTLYDRSRGKRAAQADGAKALREQAKK